MILWWGCIFISFPTTSNFIGEMLLFIGIFKDNFVIGFFAALSMF
jgi:NADH:ubiquinone oxidoreductase subunit 4 (subunit M)